jgi:argininosuccinate lyase
MPSGVDTGRLTTGLADAAHRIVYDQYLTAGSDGLGAELRYISEVDRAHLVMLTERGIVPAATAALLLREIERLRATGFAAVLARPIPRGPYLAYEGLLAEVLGDEVGGVLHTGRSRNDLNATTVRLKVRQPYLGLLREVDRLAGTLLDKAAEYAAVTMPAYTHGQPAVPITYGHYLAGLAAAVLRGLDDLLQAGAEIEVNPLGAGAVGGTSVAIDPARTTALLGFAVPAPNSVDAVASRDFVLRMLSAAAVLGTCLARAARDFSTWTTEEFALLRIGDDLVGSSSMMPQKRNPFPLEHIQGRATACTGGFVAAATAMATAGYSNAIAVGTEAVRNLWPGLANATDAVVLFRLIVAGATPERDRMVRRAADGYTAATYLAEQLVLAGLPFRRAHHRVGQTVLAALESGESLAAAARHDPQVAAVGATHPGWLEPGAVAEACAHGGGPGAGGTAAAVTALRERLAAQSQLVAERSGRWDAGRRLLAEQVAMLVGNG